MNRKLLRLCVCLALLVPFGPAKAAIIIDTQPLPGNDINWTLSSSQWLAAKFTLDADYLITDLAAWVVSSDRTGQHFTLSVYSANEDWGEEYPNADLLIYSNPATVAGTAWGSWEGYHIGYGDGLPLPAGDYWLGFEVRPPNYANPYDGFMPATATEPLQNYAGLSGDYWNPTSALDLGVRISGNPATVPVSPAVWLLGSGLVGLGLVRRRPTAG